MTPRVAVVGDLVAVLPHTPAKLAAGKIRTQGFCFGAARLPVLVRRETFRGKLRFVLAQALAHFTRAARIRTECLPVGLAGTMAVSRTGRGRQRHREKGRSENTRRNGESHHLISFANSRAATPNGSHAVPLEARCSFRLLVR